MERLATFLEAQGYEVLFVELSLGGPLPVVGLLLFHAATDTVVFSAAASHRVDVALEHCIGEMFANEFYRGGALGWATSVAADDLVRRWARSGFTGGWGCSLAQLDFTASYSTAYKGVSREKETDNTALLKHGIAVTRTVGSEVYSAIARPSACAVFMYMRGASPRTSSERTKVS